MVMRNAVKLGLWLMCAIWMTACDDSDSSSVANREGETCDSNAFEMTCDGDKVAYCSKNVIRVYNCAEKPDADGKSKTCAAFAQPQKAETCDEEDEDCILNNTSAPDDINCISTAESCTVENDVQQRCETSATGVTYLRSYRCEKAKDGRMFYRRVSNDKCYDGYGVCSSDGKCLEPVHCDDGYETHCEGDLLKKCIKNKLRISNCAAYSTPRVCSFVDDDPPTCLSPTKECTKEGDEIVTSCSAKLGKEYISVCAQADNGKLYYHSAGSRVCLSGCDDDGKACKAAACSQVGATQEKCRLQGTSTTYIDTYTCTEKDGAKIFVLNATEKCDSGYGTCSNTGQCVPAEDCDSKSFESKCENGVAINCTNKKVRYTHCEESLSSNYCAVVNGKASCYSDADMCKTENEEIVTKCIAKTGKESLKKCSRGSDGNLYYVSAGTRTCENGCNEDATKCAD